MRAKHVRPAWLRYGAAVLVTGAALALKLLLVPLVSQDEPVLLFFAAVIVAAVFGGFGPGLLATLLSALCDCYFFMPPFGHFRLNGADQVLRLAIFIAEGLFISIICARLKRAQQDVQDSAAEARELEERLLQTSDAEQRRIGHDLHDGLGQHLTGIALVARQLQLRLGAAASSDAENATKVFDLAKTAVEWTHDLCRSLSPPALESAGLAEGLRELAANAETLFNIECTFDQCGEITSPNLDAAVHLYRIAQEAISNAVRHGQAKHIILRFEATGNTISVQIIDDGKGIAPSVESANGMGLRIMRDRATMIGATIDVRHDAGGGTVVVCRYPQPSASKNGNH